MEQITIVPLLWILAVLSSCAPLPYYERLAGKVSGRVIDARRIPVAGARVEYVFRGGRVLGETVTASDGRFSLGPYSQWTYLLYIGSPGRYPSPYSMESPPWVPDALRISARGATAIYLTGGQAEVQKRSSSIILPSPLRMANDKADLMLTPDMKDSTLPDWKPASTPMASP